MQTARPLAASATRLSQRPASHRHAPVTCVVQKNGAEDVKASATVQRRAVLSSIGLALLMQTAPAQAVYKSQVCELGDDGRACRERALMDESALDYAKEAKAGKKTALVPSNQNGASSMNQDKYQTDTTELADIVAQFLVADVYDPARSGLIQTIKVKGNQWSALYAPGGSAKRESGRDFYNCLQQLQGWFAYNGIAPLNKSTTEKVTRNLADTRELLAKGR